MPVLSSLLIVRVDAVMVQRVLTTVYAHFPQFLVLVYNSEVRFTLVPLFLFTLIA